MNKKGQITLFIIIGIVVLLVAGVFLIIANKLNNREVTQEVGESSSLQSYVENCIEEVAIPAIYLQGLQGGYIFPIDDSFNMEERTYQISLLYNQGIDNVPDRARLQNEINAYIKINLNNCLDDLQSFKEMGYEVETGTINTDSIVGFDDIQIKVTYPITLTQGAKQETVEEFSATIPVRLGHLNDLSREFVDEFVEYPDRVNMNMLAGFDVDVTVVPYSQEQGIVIYSFYDEKSNIRDQRYTFLFATKTIG
jgi:hypothetical protein